MKTLKKLYEYLVKNGTCNYTYISDYENGVSFYVEYLLSTVLGRFIWNNLPSGLDTATIESMLIREGAVIDVNKNDNIYIQPLNAYGVGVYQDRAPSYVIANPILGSYTDGINWYSDANCICFENPAHFPMINVIHRTACQLARTESTIDLVCTNNNGTNLTIVSNDKMQSEINRVYEERQKGRVYIGCSARISDIVGKSWDEMQKNPTTPDILPLISAFNNQLRIFYRRFGINISKDKTQAILSDETELDTSFTYQILLDGLKCRQEFCDKLNTKYNLNVSVDISDALKIEKNVSRETYEESEEKENEDENID